MQHFIEVCERRSAGKYPKMYSAPPREKATKMDTHPVKQKKKSLPKLEETPNSVSVNWRNMQDCSLRVQKSTIRKIVKLAMEKRKKTVAIDNIAIYDPYDVNSAAKVMNAKKEVESAVAKNVKSLLHVKPVNRLFLERGRFGVRFYLGEEHPADYAFPPNER